MAPESTSVLEPGTARQALKTPRAAAIAGIIFSILLSVSLVLIRLAVPTNSRDTAIWATDPLRKSEVAVALYLVPFAGIAFLWFIGVVRDRMGEREDRFFASVFLGSGLLFVAMLFVATAIAGGLIATYESVSGRISNDVWQLGHGITYALVTTYAMRMAGVFTISTATITLRIAIMPRWIALVGYASALVLLLGSGFIPWIELVFPMWVLLVSVYILAASLGTHSSTSEHAPAPQGS